MLLFHLRGAAVGEHYIIMLSNSVVFNFSISQNRALQRG
jgi:hypothetical protein